MVIGECSAYSSLQADSKVKLQLSLRVGSHLALTDCCPYDPKWTFAYGWRRIDGTINIVLGIIIIIIIIISIVSSVSAALNAVLLYDGMPAPDCTDWRSVPNFVYPNF